MLSNAEGNIVIVGTGAGIGMSIAHRFGREGHPVTLIARNLPKLQTFQAELQQAGIEASIYEADAANFTKIAAALQQIEQQQGTPDVVIYNVAALSRWQGWQSFNPELLLTDFRVTVASCLAVVQATALGMQQRSSGTILVTSATAESYLPLPLTSLRISKPGLNELITVLHDELKPQGIHVSAMKVRGPVRQLGDYDPDAVAQEYWRIFQQKPLFWKPLEELTAERLSAFRRDKEKQQIH